MISICQNSLNNTIPATDKRKPPSIASESVIKCSKLTVRHVVSVVILLLDDDNDLATMVTSIHNVRMIQTFLYKR